MARIVMKFGGTSVSTPENRAMAMAHVRAARHSGDSVVAVVSAMGRMGAPYATDTLLSLLAPGADLRTRDLLMSCGETISACVFADALTQSGTPAMAFDAASAGIVTDEAYGCAEITGMNTANLEAALLSGLVPVITGFQGKTPQGMTATLGRGGSDTSAVVIGGYLKADTVDIYTDVNGIAKADPRLVPEAVYMDEIANADMLTLAQWGASVIHPRAVQAGAAFGIPQLRVRSTFDTATGTRILPATPQTGFIGLALLKNMAISGTGEFALGDARYAKTEDGPYAILTAVYKGCTAERYDALRAILPALYTNGNAMHALLPMENAGDAARAMYALLSA